MTHYTHQGYQIVTSLSACLALSIVIIVLRFYGRVFSRKRAPLLSDYFILAALASFISYAGVLYSMVDNPDGTIEPTQMTDLNAILTVFRRTIATQLLLVLIISLVKVSILLFYQEIFSISRTFKLVNSATIAICVVWFIIVFFVTLFQCSPVTAAWDFWVLANGGAKCISLPNLILGTEITNIAIDILIMAIPLVEMRKLQMKRVVKVTVSFVFVVGGFVAVASACRIAYTRPDGHLGPTVLVNFTQTYVWSNIQIGAAIICACLPALTTLRSTPLFNRFSSMGSRLLSLISNRSTSRIHNSDCPGDSPSGTGRKAETTHSMGSLKVSLDEEHSMEAISRGNGALV